MVHYIDTSALVKLVVDEPETPALQSWIRTASPELLSSDLARTEILRAVRRASPDRVVRARQVLESLCLLTVSTASFEAAGRLEPSIPRTLDAVHLAVALEIGDELAAVVTYDERLADAARNHGVAVLSPG